MPATKHALSRSAPDVRAVVAARRAGLVDLRRGFHMRPELSLEEHETAAAIAKHLRGIGLEVREGVGGMGVVGLLRGARPGRTLMIRADIDALPVHELNAVDYASRAPGKMHACGHDGHMAIALTVAEILADWRDRLAGNVKFVFQPAEERACGAEPMVAAGALRDPDVDAAIGLHLWSPLHVGEVAAQPGPFWASADMFTLRVRGKGGHGAMPQTTVDPILAAAQIVVAAQTLVSRETSPFDPAVVTFGAIHGGTASNVVADEVELRGTLRAFTPAVRDRLVRRLGELANGVAGALRAEAELTRGEGCIACVNDVAITELVLRAATATVGKDHISQGDTRLSASDDMAVFLQAVPGCYFLVGAGNPERGIDAPHHNARFDIAEDALPIGVEIMTRAALEYLGR
ncbi:MAG TPA: amidohydrolase [Ktedonobacterales bacterium]|jgi:amidohydrolase